MVDVVVVLLIISALVQICFNTREHPLNEVMLSKETTICAKGILACCIMLFHLVGYVQGGIAFTIIKDTGYLWTSGFFFLSGYGMLKKYTIENDCTIGALKNRILSVLIPWIFITIIYATYYLLVGQISIIQERLHDAANGFLIATHSWFSLVVILFYVIFYLVFKQRLNIILKIATIFISTLVYISVVSYLGLGMWWYYSCLSFPLGLLISYYEKDIRIKSTRAVAFIGLLLSYICRYFNSRNIGDETFYIILHLIASVMFCTLFWCCLRMFNIKHRIWNFIGKISYEVYLIHILVMDLLNYSGKNDVLYVVLVFLITMPLAYIINILITKIRRLCASN